MSSPKASEESRLQATFRRCPLIRELIETRRVNDSASASDYHEMVRVINLAYSSVFEILHLSLDREGQRVLHAKFIQKEEISGRAIFVFGPAAAVFGIRTYLPMGLGAKQNAILQTLLNAKIGCTAFGNVPCCAKHTDCPGNTPACANVQIVPSRAGNVEGWTIDEFDNYLWFSELPTDPGSYAIAETLVRMMRTCFGGKEDAAVAAAAAKVPDDTVATSTSVCATDAKPKASDPNDSAASSFEVVDPSDGGTDVDETDEVDEADADVDEVKTPTIPASEPPEETKSEVPSTGLVDEIDTESDQLPGEIFQVREASQRTSNGIVDAMRQIQHLKGLLNDIVLDFRDVTTRTIAVSNRLNRGKDADDRDPTLADDAMQASHDFGKMFKRIYANVMQMEVDLHGADIRVSTESMEMSRVATTLSVMTAIKKTRDLDR